ncbi:MAG: type II secretion system protein [Pseudohongiellaceae bacterium]
MTGRRGVQHRGAAPRTGRQQRGLTLFELVVFILVVAIIFATAFDRFREYPGAAERANFQTTLAQLRSAVNMEMMAAIATGNWQELESLEDSNPMDLLLETPDNYVGEFMAVAESSMPRRVWYFDETRGQLVYLPNDNEHLYVDQGAGWKRADSLQFRIDMRYEGDDASENSASGADREEALSPSRDQGDWTGLTLMAVTPFDWRNSRLELPR